jgi:hypothetical protein
VNEAKSIFRSKTFLFNAASIGLLWAQWAMGRQIIAPDTQLLVTGALNLMLRYVTTQPVKVP